MQPSHRERVQAYARIVATEGHAKLLARAHPAAIEQIAVALAAEGAIEVLGILHEALRLCAHRGAAGRRVRRRADRAALASLDERVAHLLLGGRRAA